MRVFIMRDRGVEYGLDGNIRVVVQHDELESS